jgi:hypothetical protein
LSGERWGIICVSALPACRCGRGAGGAYQASASTSAAGTTFDEAVMVAGALAALGGHRHAEALQLLRELV